LNHIVIEKAKFEIIPKEKILKSVLSVFVLSILLFTACNNGQTPESSLNWQNNLENAIAQAKKENKAVLVNFTGSDWCKWCIKLNNEVFTKDEFEKYAEENLVLVRLDFPRSIPQTQETKVYNNSLAQQYGVRGFPTILVFNSDGKLVAKTGYQPGGAGSYVNHIQSFL
jgi:protein disulfide-isomerase